MFSWSKTIHSSVQFYLSLIMIFLSIFLPQTYFFLNENAFQWLFNYILRESSRVSEHVSMKKSSSSWCWSIDLFTSLLVDRLIASNSDCQSSFEIFPNNQCEKWTNNPSKIFSFPSNYCLYQWNSIRSIVVNHVLRRICCFTFIIRSKQKNNTERLKNFDLLGF